jgi:uncharacterized membrane protein (UPF0136 family)
MDGDVEVYRLGPEASAAAKRVMWITPGIVAVLLLVVFTVVGILLESVPPLFWLLVPATACLLLGSAFLGNRSNQRELVTFGIAIGPDVIRRVSGQLPPMEMVRTEVARIVDAPVGLLLFAESPPRALVIPRKLAGYDRVREIVTQWRAPEVQPPRRGTGVRLIAGYVLGVVAFSAATYGPDGWVSALGTAVFLGLVTLAALRLFRERFMDPKARRVALLILGMATLAVVWRWVLPFMTGTRK